MVWLDWPECNGELVYLGMAVTMACRLDRRAANALSWETSTDLESSDGKSEREPVYLLDFGHEPNRRPSQV